MRCRRGHGNRQRFAGSACFCRAMPWIGSPRSGEPRGCIFCASRLLPGGSWTAIAPFGIDSMVRARCVEGGDIRARARPGSGQKWGWRTMFRVKASEIHGRIPGSAAIVLTTLVLASVLSVAAVYQVLEEYRLLGDWLGSSGPVSVAEIRSLRRDIGTRIIIRSTALVCSFCAPWRPCGSSSASLRSGAGSIRSRSSPATSWPAWTRG